MGVNSVQFRKMAYAYSEVSVGRGGRTNVAGRSLRSSELPGQSGRGPQCAKVRVRLPYRFMNSEGVAAAPPCRRAVQFELTPGWALFAASKTLEAGCPFTSLSRIRNEDCDRDELNMSSATGRRRDLNQSAFPRQSFTSSRSDNRERGPAGSFVRQGKTLLPNPKKV